PLATEIPTYFLAWTTTPWTLPGNTAVAVSPDSEYTIVELASRDGSPERLVLASALVSSAIKDAYGLTGSLLGRELVGLRYEPLYNPKDVPVNVLQFVKSTGGTPQLQVAARPQR